MKLISFQVWDYRSINDSGPIRVDRITALLGRNESGKSNLLRALHTLNPAEGFKPLDKKKDFPRHRRLLECHDKTKAVETLWELDEGEQEELAEIFPRAKGVNTVKVGRYYADRRYVDFCDLPKIDFDAAIITKRLRELKPQLEVVVEALADDKKTAMQAAVTALFEGAKATNSATGWAEKAAPAFANFRKQMAAHGVAFSEAAKTIFEEQEERASQIGGDEADGQEGRNWIVKQLPKFIFFEEYPDLPGQQNINEFIQRRPQKLPQDRQFEKLLKVAGLSADELHSIKGDGETRNQLTNRAGAVVTTSIQKLWKDRRLKVKFNVDGDYFETLVSDPNATYDVEVNLNERSRGFRWFFSFYITFAADTEDGNAKGAILLFDEPGLFLHALSQEDLLRHFEGDFENQIIYTTHSPFMVPPRTLSWVRTVNISEETKTTVANDPTGDSRTLFPLQSALGYTAAQSLFIGPKNVVVEGVIDFWILSAVSEHNRANGKISLAPDITLTPGGGAQKASYMVTLLTSQNLDVVLLLDFEKDAQEERERMLREKVIRSENVVFVSEAFESVPKEADVEDLLDPDVYLSLVKEAFAKELKGQTLKLNQNVPRIVHRVGEAFKALGIEFNKSRPATCFCARWLRNPTTF